MIHTLPYHTLINVFYCLETKPSNPQEEEPMHHLILFILFPLQFSVQVLLVIRYSHPLPTIHDASDAYQE